VKHKNAVRFLRCAFSYAPPLPCRDATIDHTQVVVHCKSASGELVERDFNAFFDDASADAHSVRAFRLRDQQHTLWHAREPGVFRAHP
jgi:hypothetical protein